MTRREIVSAVCLMFLLMCAQGVFAQDPNPNCTIIVPDAPLTAKGLATPYLLVATDPAAGACDESSPDQSAYVQAAVIDPATGSVSIYNPLVITQGTKPAVDPVLPTLPANAVVGLWFGYNGDVLTLQANPGVLRNNNCVNGTRAGQFGQYAYCNAPAFFRAAHTAIRRGQLVVPPIGTAADGKPCPTARDFLTIDQDQSDNLPDSFLLTEVGLAQTTVANMAQFPSATIHRNPSDEGLIARFLGPALGCSSWKAPDLADPGQMISSLALNELQAGAKQGSPVALVPAGDPMVLTNGNVDLFKLNLYRAGVDMPSVFSIRQASTTLYCQNMLNIAPARLLANKDRLVAASSPVPADGNNLYTFLAQRFVGAFDILGCGKLTGRADPISVTTDANGTAVDAAIVAQDQQGGGTTTPPPCNRRHHGHRQW